MILQFYMETVTHKLSRLREEANLAWLPHAPRPSQAGSEAHTTLRSGIREYENPHIFCCQSSLGFYLHAFLHQYHLSSIVPQDKVSAPKTAEGWVPPGPPNPLTATSKLPRTYSWVFFRVCPAEKYSGIKLYAQLFFFLNKQSLQAWQARAGMGLGKHPIQTVPLSVCQLVSAFSSGTIQY